MIKRLVSGYPGRIPLGVIGNNLGVNIIGDSTGDLRLFSYYLSSKAFIKPETSQDILGLFLQYRDSLREELTRETYPSLETYIVIAEFLFSPCKYKTSV